MSKSRIVLSFDDGRRDNLRVVEEILNPLDMKATINITTAYVDGSINQSRTPCPNAAMSRQELETLSENANIELAGHGKEHQNTLEDLGEGIRTLQEWLPNRRINGIASPNSLLIEDEILGKREAYEALGVDYVRIGPGKSYHKIRRICGVLARKTGSSWLYRYSIAGAHSAKEPGFVLLSVPVMRQHTLPQVQALVDDAARQGHDLILMFHSILKPDEDYYDDTWSWDYNDFAALCRNLSEREDVTVVTTQELSTR